MPALPWNHAYVDISFSSSPQNQGVALPSRQAYSHWASVGKENFIDFDNEVVLSLACEHLNVRRVTTCGSSPVR